MGKAFAVSLCPFVSSRASPKPPDKACCPPSRALEAFKHPLWSAAGQSLSPLSHPRGALQA